jgi:sortase B
MKKALSFIFAALLIMSSALLIYNFVVEPFQLQDTYAKLAETKTVTKPVVTDYDEEDNQAVNETLDLPQFSFDSLKKKNSDTAGWLKLDDNHQFPVVQNDQMDAYNKYLHTSFDGLESDEGTLYFGSDVKEDSRVITINGHNMKRGTMFGCLPLYRNLSYTKAHPTFELARTTDGVINRYKIVAVCSVSVNYEANDFYFPQADYSSETEFKEFVEKIKDHSFFTMDNFSDAEQVVILNTCAYGFATERTLVVGVLDNTSDINVDSYGINTERVNPIP